MPRLVAPDLSWPQFPHLERSSIHPARSKRTSLLGGNATTSFASPSLKETHLLICICVHQLTHAAGYWELALQLVLCVEVISGLSSDKNLLLKLITAVFLPVRKSYMICKAYISFLLKVVLKSWPTNACMAAGMAAAGAAGAQCFTTCR